jgi:small subunit ribosomal protein S17
MPMTEEPENVEVEATDADATSADVTAGSADEAPAPAEEAAAEPAGPPAEAAEVLAPKERRARSRAAKASKQPTRKPMTAEERQAERDEIRSRKAAARKVERQRARAKAKAAPHGRESTPPREHEPGRQKTRQGIVVSDKADKTITVRIDIARRHRRYQKIVRTSNTLHAHDERNDAHIGDTVVVRESRPLSRSKRWRLIEVVERAK